VTIIFTPTGTVLCFAVTTTSATTYSTTTALEGPTFPVLRTHGLLDEQAASSDQALSIADLADTGVRGVVALAISYPCKGAVTVTVR
jgi:hypothetical protein